MARPPIGVFNLKDIAFMLCCIILVSFLYLMLPLWLVAGLLALLTLSILYITLEPLLRVLWIIWVAALILLILDVGTALVLGTKHSAFLSINNTVLIIAIVGISNLWAQSELKARDAALLGVLLAVYDVIATIELPLMADLFTPLAALPFIPLVGSNTYTQVRVKEVNVSSLLSVGLIWMRQLPCDRFLVGKAVILPRGSPSDRGLAR